MKHVLRVDCILSTHKDRGREFNYSRYSSQIIVRLKMTQNPTISISKNLCHVHRLWCAIPETLRMFLLGLWFTAVFLQYDTRVEEPSLGNVIMPECRSTSETLTKSVDRT